jgi:hypothetical protein
MDHYLQYPLEYKKIITKNFSLWIGFKKRTILVLFL